jgi:aldehyde:ferredoxin oxidoreductase
VGGTTDGVKLKMDDFEHALDEYYAHMGLQKETGRPTLEMLRTLDLEELSAGLE